MTMITARVSKNGALTVPAEYWQALGVTPGDEVIVCLEADELRIFTRQAAISRVQALLRNSVPAGRSLVDELIAERRAEAAREG